MIRNIYWKYICSNLKKQLVCSLFLILFIHQSQAQNQINGEIKQFYAVISFDEKMNFGDFDADVSWKITNSQNNINISLQGNEINDYVFQQPGDYEINFTENRKHNPDECNHPAMPEKVLVKVQPVKLVFDFSKIQFSEKLQKGRNYSDLIITVPAKVISKDNSITKLPAPGLSVNGIGVALAAKPVNTEIVLNNKIQLLKYKISGKADKEAYLMFDFYDFNNQVQTYNLSEKIK